MGIIANKAVRFMTAGTLLASAVLGTNAATVSTASARTASASVKIALLLPETVGSVRYETQDKPDFEKAVTALDPSAKVLYSNAQGDQPTQLQQAESALTNGANVLVVDPVDGVAAAAIVAKAKAANVPVISYDRLIMNAPVDYYVSFNNELVGELQGQYIKDHTKQGGTVVMLNGAKDDNNALLFAAGAHKVLDPLFKSGKLKRGYESYTPKWDPANGQREMEQALTNLKNKVDGVLAANDGLAGAVATALQEQKISGVPITGQDATDAGLHRIYYQHTQSMTVYKAINLEANKAAELALDLATGKKPAAGLINGTTSNNKEQVKSVLLKPVVVTQSNVQSTVIKDHFTTWAKIKNPGK